MKIQEFLSSSSARRRYWARNFFAWPRFSSFKPNIVHTTLHGWELKGKVNCLVTQNVDGLHKKAGSEGCIELHGTIHRVVCISCEYQVDRRIFQNVLMDFNASLRLGRGGVDSQLIRPDGDISIDDASFLILAD
jgi:NAD-dependent deacetylase sirtuin 4